MELLVVLGWFVMAIICSMVAAAKRGVLVGLIFFFYGLIIWPIALVHALLMHTNEVAPRADGLVNGKPYWRTPDGQYNVRVDGRDASFRDLATLEAAMGGRAVAASDTRSDDDLLGNRLARKIFGGWWA